MPLRPAGQRALSTFQVRILPALGCALLARAYLSIGCWYAERSPWAARQWGRWDSQNYINIAMNGYTDGKTTGWFPGYSWLMHPFVAIGLDAWVTGAVFSFLFLLGSLLLIWNYILDARSSPRNVLCLLLASFFPGHVYHQAIFPMSMLIFFTLLLFILLMREKWISAAFAGAAAAVTYTTGFLLAPVVTLWLLIFHGRRIFLERKIIVLAPPLGVTLGFLLVMAVQDVSSGFAGSFFRSQDNVGFVKFSDPIRVLKRLALRPLNARKIKEEWNREGFSLRASNGNLVGMYLRQGDGRVLIAKSKQYSPAFHALGERQLEDGKIALKAHGRVLHTDPERTYPTLEYLRQIGPSEALRKIELEGDRTAFQTAHGTYLGLGKSKRIVSTATSLGERETFVRGRSRDFLARSSVRRLIQALQTLVICGTGLIAIALLAVAERKSLALHILILIHALAYFVFPLTTGTLVNHFRAQSLLLLLVIPVRNAGVAIQLLLAIAYLALSYPVAVLFFQKMIT